MGSVDLNENLETFPMTVCANAHVYVRARLSMYKNLDDIHISFFLSLSHLACMRVHVYENRNANSLDGSRKRVSPDN